MPGRILPALAIWVAVWGGARDAAAVDRFPRPQFESGHVVPRTTTPPPHDWGYESLDTLVLLLVLALTTYLVLRYRRRRAVVVVVVFSLLYFGFWREGCVCPVGSTQNVALALTDPGYAVPWTVLAFFALPLLFTLFFGRTFCAAACPLGAIQDLVVLWPVRLPVWLARGLGLLPPLVLGLAVLLVVTGAGFPVCEYDPFVALFRRGGSLAMVLLGVGVLLLGTVVARPYCRFFCPYGVLLGWMALFSRWHARITPDPCIQCRLCEAACPFGAIEFPTPSRAPESRAAGVRRLAWLAALLPVVLAVSLAAGYAFGPALARTHARVRLAERIRIEESAGGRLLPTLESEAWRSLGGTREQLAAEAAALRARFRRGGAGLGLFMGVVVWGQLVALSLRWTRRDYEIDRMACLSCGRCFESCPREHVRRRGGEGRAG